MKNVGNFDPSHLGGHHIFVMSIFHCVLIKPGCRQSARQNCEVKRDLLKFVVPGNTSTPTLALTGGVVARE